MNGYNSVRFAVKGWRWILIDYQLSHLSELKGYMPPFVGTEEERKALGAWLATLNPTPASVEIEPPPPGEKAQVQPAPSSRDPQP